MEKLFIGRYGTESGLKNKCDHTKMYNMQVINMSQCQRKLT